MVYQDEVSCPNCGILTVVAVESIPQIYIRRLCSVCLKPFELNVAIKFEVKKWPFE